MKEFIQALATYVKARGKQIDTDTDLYDQTDELLRSLGGDSAERLLSELQAMGAVVKAAEQLQSALDELDKVKTLRDWDANDKSLSRAMAALAKALKTYKKL